VPQVAGSAPVVQQLIHRNHPERTDFRQRTDLRSAKLERLTAEEYSLALASARQIEALAKDVTRIERVTSPGILNAISSVPEGLLAAIDIARV
jgi:hypothetical protein